MARLKKIKTESLRSQVYSQLKARLMEGVWKVGEKLPSESELCETFGVSRVTVRAAIQQLEILGLVETRHGGGNFVRDFSTIDAVDALHPLIQISRNQDIITVLEYRKIVEKGTIGLAVPKVTAKDIKRLEETYTTMVNLSDSNDPVRQADADHQFHYQLALIAQNPIIIKVYELINVILASTMVDIVALLGTDLGLLYHRKLIDAIKSGDKALCEQLMDEHLEATIQRVREKSGHLPGQKNNLVKGGA